jgi:Domain of unknown function (DUF4203)
MNNLMNIITLIVGFILLFAGRKLYWLFVAVVGFFTGYFLAGQIFPQTSTILQIIIGLVAGTLGAALLFFLHQLAIGIAGFLGGGLLAIQIVALSGQASPEFNWIPFIIGGVFGAVLVTVIFDWALIVLTSLGGAFLIISGFNSISGWSNLAILALFAIGIIIQANLLRGERRNTNT